MSHLSDESIFQRLEEDRGLGLEESNLSIDKSYFDRELKRKELEEKDESLKDHKQDREQRKTFSSWIFVFMCAYMSISLVIVFCCGFEWMQLDNSVLVALLTTTLANVIGVFNFVAKYLFHRG